MKGASRLSPRSVSARTSATAKQRKSQITSYNNQINLNDQNSKHVFEFGAWVLFVIWYFRCFATATGVTSDNLSMSEPSISQSEHWGGYGFDPAKSGKRLFGLSSRQYSALDTNCREWGLLRSLTNHTRMWIRDWLVRPKAKIREYSYPVRSTDAQLSNTKLFHYIIKKE